METIATSLRAATRPVREALPDTKYLVVKVIGLGDHPSDRAQRHRVPALGRGLDARGGDPSHDFLHDPHRPA
jgi:hypothetical protein